MGLPSDLSLHAWHRDEPDRRDDRGQASAGLSAAGCGVHAGLILWAAAAAADPVRIATFNAELSRDGPGLLLRDIREGEADILAAARVIAAARPDILLLTGFDYDAGLVALTAFAARVEEAGWPMAARFAFPPNTGRDPFADRDGDGRIGTARDGQGYGEFAGQGAMAVLSRWPVLPAQSRDFSALLWRDLPGALLSDGPPPEGALADQRLSSTGHWDVAVETPLGPIHLLAWHATPPVFDGPDDRNGRRNHDEAAFWLRLLDGALDAPPPAAPFVLLGDANLDPEDGDGLRGAMDALLGHPDLTDPRPRSGPGAGLRNGVNAAHRGDPALDTAFWDAEGPGNLRVDYVLPSRALTVLDAGLWWPEGDTDVPAASRHRLVWVDVTLP
jgi:hypothetical protein